MTRVHSSDPGILSRPAPSTGTKTAQAGALTDWVDGLDTAGPEIARTPVPTLIADGTGDQLDPIANR